MAPQLVSLDRIDPAEAWQAWSPSAADPWGRKWAAHVYRRGAFGASRENLFEAVRLGPGATIELLLRGRPHSEELLPTLVDIGRVAAIHDSDGDQLRGWWLYCMLQGGHPLREKLTLFWHNHFATSITKVQNPAFMFRQNCLLRQYALGKFDTLLQEISRDAAMLIWLDSNSNVAGRPNENYARELMELFSLGVGHYTEKDIREAARAFTGWHTEKGRFKFNANAHDAGAKTVLGKSGNWDGVDVVRVVLEQPAASRFLVRKLYHAFISENAEPPDSLLQPLCDSFRKNGYDIAALVRTMLSSRHFFSEHAFRQRVKSPVEFVLGAVQAVYRRYDENEADFQPLPQQALVSRINAMGQSLFAPPNVKGWPGGRAWLNTSTLLERSNFAAALALGTVWSSALPKSFVVSPTHAIAIGSAEGQAGSGASSGDTPALAVDPARLLSEERVQSPEDIVRALLDLYVPGGIRPESRAKLVAFLSDERPSGAALHRRVRETVHAIMTLPEYQLA